MRSNTDSIPKNGHAATQSRVGERRRLRDVEADRLWGLYVSDRCAERRNSLVEHYQALVRDIVRRFAMRLPASVERGDLLTAANVGLMGAIAGFDSGRGVRFEFYCELRVKGALLDELRIQDWLPRPWRQRIELQKRTLERLRSEEGQEPRDEDVAEAMNMPLGEYEQLFGVGLPGVLGGPAGEEGDEYRASALDRVPARETVAPDEKLSREELLTLVAQRLTDQEYRVVYLKYWECLPMREIGELAGLSESRVCKIHARLIERLQDRFRVGQDD